MLNEKALVISKCQTYLSSPLTDPKFEASDGMGLNFVTQVAWKNQHKKLHQLFIESELKAAANKSQDNSEDF